MRGRKKQKNIVSTTLEYDVELMKGSERTRVDDSQVNACPKDFLAAVISHAQAHGTASDYGVATVRAKAAFAAAYAGRRFPEASMSPNVSPLSALRSLRAKSTATETTPRA